MADIVTTAFGMLARTAGKPAIDAVKRREKVIALLKRLGMEPDVLPRDFKSLYAYAIVHHCHGMPKNVLAFFHDEDIQTAFERAFKSGDLEELNATSKIVQSRMKLTSLDYDLTRAMPDFLAVFSSLVDRSQAVAETRLERKVDLVLDRLEIARVYEEQRRAELQSSQTPVVQLADDLREWFDAVGHRIDRVLHVDEESFAWLVLIPVRRRRPDRIVVLGVDGELGLSDLKRLEDLVESTPADEGWGVAPQRVSQAARKRCGELDGNLLCMSFDELIDQDADFEPYIEWLEQQITERKIEQRYVPLSCEKSEVGADGHAVIGQNVYEWREGGLDEYVTRWMEDPSKEHLSLLGEFGTGKTWFCLHYAWNLAKLWREAKRRGRTRPRVPLVIPLREYAKATTVEMLLSEFFFRRHEILPGGYSVFRQLNKMGRLLLIFDGFDEMAARVDRQAMVNNFWELATVVSERSKIILSCRSEHFPRALEGRELLSARLKASVAELTGQAPQFEVVELRGFDDEQVRMMLASITTAPIIDTIMSNDQLLDLVRRPVMSELIIDALPEIDSGAELDLATVYFHAMHRKMQRDIASERTFTSLADKLFFLCEVAWEMLSTDTLSINYRDVPERVRTYFGEVVADTKDLDYWQHDMRAQTMLIRNDEGDYRPAHKSMLEFLVAYKFGAELGLLSPNYLSILDTADNDSRFTWSEYFTQERRGGSLPKLASFSPETVEKLTNTMGSTRLNDVVKRFLAAMIGRDEDTVTRLFELTRATAYLTTDEAVYLGGNCLELLVELGEPLHDSDLHEVKLKGFGENRTSRDLRNCNLRAANFSGVDCIDIDLSGADLTDATFSPGFTPLDGSKRVSIALTPNSDVLARINEHLFSWTPDSRPTTVALIEEMPLASNVGVIEGQGTWSVILDGKHALNQQMTPLSWQPSHVRGKLTWKENPAILTVDRYLRPGGAEHLYIIDAATLQVVTEIPFPPNGWNGRLGANGGAVRHISEEGLVHTFSEEKEAWHLSGSIVPHQKAGITVDNGAFVYVKGDSEQPPSLLKDWGLEVWILTGEQEVTSAVATDTRYLVVQQDGLKIWQTTPIPVLLWQLPDVKSNNMLVRKVDQSLIVISRNGCLSQYSLADGRLMNEVFLSTFVDGANFTGCHGLDERELALLRSAGAITGA